ncbi:Protein of unknown function [Edaphobacillus lindanitolerans]|uniref:Uncharacterized protein n=2 Tax=Bacilli TaxID=91061 RepID=A0A1U7PQ21_9BACI|nr:Protein of unknown function [Edaphobacillus lindanitolerans]
MPNLKFGIRNGPKIGFPNFKGSHSFVTKTERIQFAPRGENRYNEQEIIAPLIKEGTRVDNMYKLMGFWTGIFAVMFYVGGMMTPSLLMLASTGFFILLGYMNLTERMYMYILGAYLMVFMVGFSYYTNFIHVPGAGH